MKGKHSPLFVIFFIVAALSGCGDSGSKDGTPADPGGDSESQESEQSPEQPRTYDITLVTTDGGSLSLTGTQTVEEGTGFSVTIMPRTGYRIESASGCEGMLTDNIFSVDAVTADCAINVSFAHLEYSVTVNASDNGSVTPSATQGVLHGDSLALMITPDSGYRIESASGCGGRLTDNTFSVDAVTTDCTISITFSRKGELNDTGITLCGNYDAENENQWSSSLNCGDAGATQIADGIDAYGNLVPAGQDAHYGRDALAVEGRITKTGGGDAGFDFTKLDASGNDLPEGATEWSCVRDNVTGLIWEVKAPTNGIVGESLHDADDRYNWYSTESSTNGGSVGYADDDGAICYGYDNADSATYCNTGAFVSRVNAAGLCGANDWRMPRKEEVRSIVHYGRANPSIDTDYFPNTLSFWYWSGTAYANHTRSSWLVNVYHGYVNAGDRSSAAPVRLVRSGPR